MSSLTTCIYRPLPSGDEDIEIEVTVEGNYVPFTPARTYGPPEDCYPSEGGYADDVVAYITLPPRPGTHAVRHGFIPLTQSEIEQFSEQLAEYAAEDERDYYEERDDYDD